MVVVHRAHGLRFVIYVDDHEPAHVHVRGDGEAKVLLAGEDGSPQILRVNEMTRADQRRMMREIAKQQAMLLERWKEIHG
ncbi:DUF4160 domain-containing protein [Sphingomonas sp. S1-29]|uniref:DUF4160 domain-containing protein n=1 Tax=Sphingomonas sp. S1-29 TaxID=2991074 RepID=UPI002240CF27|nr:DUF4160 domain-containing protein [Sphingomonas sp. S1-29]UZK68388.1 DUF4160 domain-containing protein [Sphingomonas sp. S1-29]